jgi:hypothetical protein
MEEHEVKQTNKSQDEPPRQDSGRRSFLQSTALAVGSATLLGGFLQAVAITSEPKLSEKGSQIERPGQLHTKLSQWKETPLSDGRECEGVFEVKDEDGNTEDMHYFGKWTNHGKQEYMVVQRFAPTKLSRGFVCVVSGTKGRVQGEYRTDRVATTFVDDNGTVQRNPESEVKVLLVNPYQGMPAVPAAEAFRRDRDAGNLNH